MDNRLQKLNEEIDELNNKYNTLSDCNILNLIIKIEEEIKTLTKENDETFK